jgi:transcriptional regulator with XRE-family HTH domain
MSYFGQNIRKIRIVKKLTQTEFADLFGLSRTAVGSYEEGRAEAKIDTIIKIADYFDLSLDQLVRKEITINEIFHFDKKIKKNKE